MIGLLRGKILGKQPPHLLLDVQGVGYEIEAPMTTFYDLPAVGEEVTLFTHLAVRDDAHTLYGFAKLNDRDLFRSLLRVNGVGAKLALTILSGMDTQTFVGCIQGGDTATLVRLPGVGKKTAERLIIEMRDRLGALTAGQMSGAQAGTGGAPPANPTEEAVTALIGLGYKPQEASHMVRAIETADLSSEEIIRHALQSTLQ
jgi:Holliday junction DNA helicase RuvA